MSIVDFQSVKRPSLLLASAMALAACAPLPQQSAPAPIKPASGWSAAEQFKDQGANWPADSWWQSYGDAQLNDLINEALAGTPSLAIAQARLDRAAAGVEIRDAATGPQLSANGSVTAQKQSYNYLTPKSALPKGEHGYARATLDFSWEIDFWGRNRAALAAATSELTAAQAETAQARLMLTTSVASAYAELARQFATEDTARAAVEVRGKTAKLFRERYDNGLETLGSVRQAEARFSAAQSELLGVQEQIQLQRNRIAALLGKGPDRGLSLARPKIDLAKPMGLPKSVEANLLGRRPDIVAARLRAQAAAKRIDVAQAEFYPNVNLNAFFGAQSLGVGNLLKAGSNIGSIGPAISLPIFNGGRLKAQLKSSRADYDEAVANYDQTVTQALQAVADAAISQRELTGQLGHTTDAVNAAREAWQIASRRYEGGLSNYIDVLTAEDTLLMNLRGLTDLQSRAFTLDVAMVRALGGGFKTE
jgi:NodT family efflux transporter outer membrane factor (OMF) lipoprotein